MDKKPTNTAAVRESNASLVRDALRGRDAVTKADLAAATGLSFATCGKILADMLDRDEAMELELAPTREGRPPRLYAYNPLFSLTALVFPRAEDGRVSIAYEIRDARDRRMEYDEFDVRTADIDAIRSLLDDLVRRRPSIKCIALSIPGLIQNGRVGVCDIPELEGMDLNQALAVDYDRRFLIENDVNLAALGYYHEVQGRGSVVYMMTPRRNCTGAGIVVDGVLLRGQTCFAGELSFIPLGISRARQFEGLPPSEAMDYLSALAAIVIPVVNPTTLVVAADVLDEQALPRIRAHCAGYIPEEHLPAFVHRTINEDCLSGLRHLAALEMDNQATGSIA